MQSRIITLIVLAFTAFSANAQKLASIQTGNIVAPAKVDIDGKAIEWNNNFQAYNKNTGVSYILANDEKNLYLVVQSSASANNNKIIRGGITFIVNTAGKKKGGSTVLFPVVAPMSVASLMQKMNGGQRGGNMGSMSPEQIMKRADSIMTAANKAELAKFKVIKVKGFPSITDSLLSIYNEHGIKTAAALDEKGIYTYELSIPLEALSLSSANPKEFNYNIMVNGIEISGMNGGGGFGGGGFSGGFSDEMLAMVSAADFWGKYTPAKK